MQAQSRVFILVMMLVVGGCSGGGTNPAGGTAGAAKGPIKGALNGGQSPICNSTVTLVGAGLEGNCGTATTDSSGNFNIVPVACGAISTTQMYIVATGGVPNTNSCPGNSNTAIALSAALGQFDSLPGFVNIDEVTTVASVWALNQFLNFNGQSLLSPGLNTVGMDNAARAVTSKNLVDVSTGKAPASFGPGVLSPTSKLYTLADMLASCVNTSSSGSPECTQLLCLAAPGGGGSPCGVTPLSDTLAAAINITRNPADNVTALFNLVTPSSPFQPTLASAPTDWLLAITFNNIGGLSNPWGIAIDGEGNVWTANNGNNSVSKFNPVGVALTGATGFTGFGILQPKGIPLMR